MTLIQTVVPCINLTIDLKTVVSLTYLNILEDCNGVVETIEPNYIPS